MRLRKVGTPVLEAPEKAYAPRTGPAAARQAPRRVSKGPSLRRDTSEDFARPETDADGFPRPRGLHFKGLRFRLKSGVPTSMVGRVVAGTIVLGGLAAFTAVIWEARSALLHDPRLVIPSSSSIQIVGNEHLTRPQLLSVFGDDVDRNILTVSLEDRKASLETLPWVEHATVMRLLPNKLRIAIVERTPVAYVRQGSHIGLVDAHGVLLDMSPEAATHNDYSFPVVTGISADDPLSTRAARMALFTRFMTDLDAGGEKVTDRLSEVDLSSPEDVKALIPSGLVSGKMADILVHFGDDDFLARYQRYQQRLPDWLTQYPKLASVDMRYERQVVLEMAKGATVEEAPAPSPVAATPARAEKAVAKHGVPSKPVKKAARPISKQGGGR